MVKRALVTGACGFSGSHMVDLLSRKGSEVTATDLPKDVPAEVAQKADFIPADLTDKKSLKKLFEKKVDYVFNLASLFDYTAQYKIMHKVNVEGTRNLLEVVLGEDVKRFVHWSTVDVYGKLNPKLLPYNEDSPKNPVTNYQKTKWEGEQLVSRYGEEHGLPVTIMRPAPIHGPGNFYGMAILYFMVAKGELSVVPSKMEGRIPFIHVEDLNRTAVYLAKCREAIGEVYNVLDDSNVSFDESEEILADAIGVKLTHLYLPSRVINFFLRFVPFFKWVIAMQSLPGERPKLEEGILEGYTQYGILRGKIFDNSKLKATGFKFKYPDWKRYIYDIIKWYKDRDLLYAEVRK